METNTTLPTTAAGPTPNAGAQTATPAITPGLTDIATWLKDEIAETHAAVMGVHKFAAEDKDPELQLNCMKAAARMMQAQAIAALSLQRLMGGKGQTVTIVHEKRNTPPPEKSKTNDRSPGWNFKEISEDDLYEEDLAWRKAHGKGPPRFRIIEVMDEAPSDLSDVPSGQATAEPDALPNPEVLAKQHTSLP